MPDLASTQLARGMRDLLPEEMGRVRRVELAFSRTCRAWGYGEIRTPVIEPLHLFTAAGTLSPQTLDRVYSFLDWDGWSGERVVLRPDSTIAAARLYAERLDGGRVAKLFYSQPVLRFTDDGSSREDWQCGVELIGDTGRTGDVELVSLALEALGDLALPAVEVRLSHAGIVRGVLAAADLAPEEQSAAYDRLLDGDLAVVDEVEARLPQLNAPLRLLFEIEGEGSGYIANLRASLASAVPELAQPLDELAFVIESLEARGVAPRVNAVLARRFEYYSGIVMGFASAGKRIGAGGRYDDLIGLVGGARVPASGFALFVSPLIELVAADPGRATPALAVEAASATPRATAAAYDAARALREAGITVETIVSAPVRAGGQTARMGRLLCADASPRYTLERDGGTAAFERIADVIAALERAR
ncbi:MAG: ATP phosphoribosyltransferase regulatory subunit [Dehalococcoidia bacterium]